MLKPLNIQIEVFDLHPIRQSDMEYHDMLIEGLFSIYNDSKTSSFFPERFVDSLQEAQRLIVSIVGNYQTGIYTHFLTDRKSKRVAAILTIILLERSKIQYDLPLYPLMLEYYTAPTFRNKKLTKKLIFAALKELFFLNYRKIGAMVAPTNLVSVKILTDFGFTKHSSLNLKKDFYIKQ